MWCLSLYILKKHNNGVFVFAYYIFKHFKNMMQTAVWCRTVLRFVFYHYHQWKRCFNLFSVLAKINRLMSFCFLGLMYVIETQKVLDLKVNLMASYVIVPQTGFYNGTQNILLLDLGHFKVRKGAELKKWPTQNCVKNFNWSHFWPRSTNV